MWFMTSRFRVRLRLPQLQRCAHAMEGPIMGYCIVDVEGLETIFEEDLPIVADVIHDVIPDSGRTSTCCRASYKGGRSCILQLFWGGGGDGGDDDDEG